MGKTHIPKAGWCAGLQGTAMCGRGARYGTGDHRLLRQLALKAMREGDYGHYCKDCIKAMCK